MRGVLQGYDRRYDRLVDWVSETEGTFRDDRLAELLGGRSADPADLRDCRPLAHVTAHETGRQLMIRGIGVDAVDIERFRRSLERTPSMHQRLFTADELAYVRPKADPVPSLAARFAAREAVMKALGVGLGAFGFHDVWVRRAESGEPTLVVTGTALRLAARRGRAAMAPVDHAHRHPGDRLRRRQLTRR